MNVAFSMAYPPPYQRMILVSFLEGFIYAQQSNYLL